MTTSTPYDSKFFDTHEAGSARSAEVIVPLVMALIAPRSVVDVGCGVGIWLRAFADSGVDDYLGLDGAYVDQSRLHIPTDRFQVRDLTTPTRLGRKFDLAVCLEVAEHLPESAAARFIAMLTDAAPVVLYSAAFAGQGGTHHVNERWPWYWEALFAKHDYVRLDPIRPQIWTKTGIDWWYKQNTYVYARKADLPKYPQLAAEYHAGGEVRFELVSESLLQRTVTPPLRTVLKMLPRAAWNAVARRSWRKPPTSP